MTTQEKTIYREVETSGRVNRTLYRVTNILGLTTGLGVIAWGVWSLIATLATFFYEESGVSLEETLVNNAFNEGLLLSAVVIALGVIILELKKIQELMQPDSDRQSTAGAE